MKPEVTNTIAGGLEEFDKKYKKANEKACWAVGIQLLNFCANGSPNDPVTPPIDTGYLRGSGSVFFNNTLISATPSVKGKGNPLKSFSIGEKENQSVISIIYNTAYALRMHEGEWKPGASSVQAGNVGRKWLSRHLEADAADLVYLYSQVLKKELGT